MRRLWALAAMALIGAFTLTTSAGADHGGPAASQAEAYALLVDVRLLPTHTPVKQGPLAWAAQSYPPGADQPDEAEVLSAGPLPADGSLVQNVGVMQSIADADDEPQAVAASQAADVALLNQGEDGPRITASLVQAQANADCENDPNATGTTFVDLEIDGTPIENTPAPNTVIDLTVAKVILNEQRPAFDGRGIVVNAIHVISTTEGDPLFRGDIIVAHAMSTVHCPGDGPGTTGENSVLPIVKTVTPDDVEAGDEVTYTATITNNSTEACLVTKVVDHLPIGFEYVSTAGDLGDAATAVTRPDGGIDIELGNGETIAADGGSVTQTFVVKVGDDVEPGTYFNNVEVFCANLGNFVKGLDAPVTVSEQTVTTTSSTPTTLADELPADELPETGTLPVWPLGLLALAVALGVQRARAVASKSDL